MNTTKLEIAVLKEIAREHPEIASCIGTLVVHQREYSGAGSFTHFEKLSDPILEYPEFRRLPLSRTVTLPELRNGLGGFLEVVGGSPNMLELYTFGEEGWSGNEEGFTFEP